MKKTPTARPAASTRRVVSRVGVALLLVVLAIGAAAASSDAAGPTLTITKSSTPTSVTCDIGSLAAGQVVTLKIVLTIPASLTGNSFTNTASATLNEGANDQQ